MTDLYCIPQFRSVQYCIFILLMHTYVYIALICKHVGHQHVVQEARRRSMLWGCCQLKFCLFLLSPLWVCRQSLIHTSYTKNKISYMSCLLKHDIFSRFLLISGRGWGRILENEWNVPNMLPYPTDFLHVQNPNFHLVDQKSSFFPGPGSQHSWGYTCTTFLEGARVGWENVAEDWNGYLGQAKTDNYSQRLATNSEW